MAIECLGTYQRRDKLLGLFWPESEEHKARSSLSEALSRLRGSLGPDVVLARGKDEISLSQEHISCDAAELLAAGTRGTDPTEIARLYRGPLLDGFFIDHARGYEHWLDSARGRIDRIALEALGSLADAAIASGSESALEWAETAVARFPSDGRAVRRLMILQARSGHRTIALDTFGRYTRRLADERGLDPSADMVELAERIKVGEAWEPLKEEAGAVPRGSSDAGVSEGQTALFGSIPVDDAPARNTAHSSTEPGGGLAERPADTEAYAGSRLMFALTLVSIIVVGAAAWSRLRPIRPTPVLRVEVTPPAGSAMVRAYGDVVLALSPDGERVIYTGEGPQTSQLWERRLQAIEPAAIPGTAGAANPAFSPDGSAILFWQDNSLKTISREGGLASTVVDGLERQPFAHWGSDGRIYYAQGKDIYSVSASGGPPEQVTTEFGAEFGGASARLPHLLPDGRGLLVTLRKTAFNASIGVVAPGGKEIRELFRGTTARYAAASGHIVYATLDGALMAVPFDLNRLEVTGAPVELAREIDTSFSTSAAQFALSGEGSLAYRTKVIPATYQVVWVDRLGRVTEIDPGWTFGGSDRFSSLALSPDGTRLAVSLIESGEVDLWIKPIDGGPADRFTFDGRGNNRPSWSPDGTYLTYSHDRSQGGWALSQKRVDGSGEAETLVDRGVGVASFSRDGRWLVYSAETPSSDIYAHLVGAEIEARPLVATDAAEYGPTLSPNGRWLAYSSDVTGEHEVYVRSFPAVDSVVKQVSTSGGTEVVWSSTGRELFYRNGADELTAVEVVEDPTFSVGSQTALFSAADFLGSFSHPIYDVRADGQAFAMIRTAVPEQPSRLVLVQNLFEELKSERNAAPERD